MSDKSGQNAARGSREKGATATDGSYAAQSGLIRLASVNDGRGLTIIGPEPVEREAFQAAVPFSEQLDLFRYWDEIRGSDRFPKRRAFDPVKVHSTLLNLGMIDVRYVGAAGWKPEFRYRLVGSETQAFFRESLKGKTVHQSKNPAYADYLTGLYNTVIRHGGPICVHESNKLPSGYYIFRGRIYLPAEPDEKGRPTILFYSTLDPERAALNIDPADVAEFPRDQTKIWVLNN